MTRRRKKKNDNLFTLFVILTIMLFLTLLVIGGFKVYRSIENEIDKEKHPILYSEYVEKYSKEYGVPEIVIYSTIKAESNFDPNAVSVADACGLMQILPSTFNSLVAELDGTETGGDIFDPEINIKYGTYYLSKLYKRFGEWKTVHAAYNAGETRVASWLTNEKYAKDGKLTNIPYKETSNYVIRIANYKEKYKELYEMGE